MIPYGRQLIDEDDIAAVVAALESDFLTQGPRVPEFERTLAAQAGARGGVAVSSATAALHIACLALEVSAGDLVWTSPITFVASANCALYCGAEIDFVDIDPLTYCMCPMALEAKLAEGARNGRLPKVVIPVHFAGQSCDMRAISRLAQQYRFSVIEDASHAVGAEYLGEPVGNCRFSDIAVFSFHPVKIITTAEGGLALTNQPHLAERMRLLRSHGVTRDTGSFDQPDRPAWYYEQRELGFNYRMTDLQAALGISQAAKLDRFVAQRRRIAARYDREIVSDRLATPWQSPDGRSSYHLYVILLRDPEEGEHRSYFDGLREAGLGVNLHYIPVYLQPFYRERGFRPGYCPEAERYYGSAVSIPLHPGMTVDDEDRVIAAVLDGVRS